MKYEDKVCHDLNFKKSKFTEMKFLLKLGNHIDFIFYTLYCSTPNVLQKRYNILNLESTQHHFRKNVD